MFMSKIRETIRKHYTAAYEKGREDAFADVETGMKDLVKINKRIREKLQAELERQERIIQAQSAAIEMLERELAHEKEKRNLIIQ